MTPFGKLIKKLMIDNDYKSYAALAGKLGWHPQRLGGLIRGTRMITGDEYSALKALFPDAANDIRRDVALSTRAVTMWPASSAQAEFLLDLNELLLELNAGQLQAMHSVLDAARGI